MVREFLTKLKQRHELNAKFREIGNQKLLEQMEKASDTDAVDKIRKAKDELNGRKKRPPIDPNTLISAGAMLGGVGLIGLIEHNVGPINKMSFSWLTTLFKGGKKGG